jgi:antitoxin component YwqK of YwqJK toxin-antitoxin module
MEHSSKRELATNLGTLKAVSNAEYYPSGQLKSATVEEKSVLETPYGRLVPNYGHADLRKKQRESVSFYEDGSLESIYLESPQSVQTSIGSLEAELLTFYPDGSIKRLFPLYGQTGGYWTEEDEYRLAKRVELHLLGQTFVVAPLCISFYPTGQVKSLTIWQQETVEVETPYGKVKSHFGFELAEDGSLKSVEPSFGTVLATRYGSLYPYDSENYRLHAEKNSLAFDANGKLRTAKTIKNKIVIQNGKRENVISAGRREDPLTGMERRTSLTLWFDRDTERIRVEDGCGLKKQFDAKAVTFAKI